MVVVVVAAAVVVVKVVVVAGGGVQKTDINDSFPLVAIILRMFIPGGGGRVFFFCSLGCSPCSCFESTLGNECSLFVWVRNYCRLMKIHMFLKASVWGTAASDLVGILSGKFFYHSGALWSCVKSVNLQRRLHE